MEERRMAPIRVASLDELPPGGKLAVQIEGTPVLVLRVDDQIYAIHNICSHAHALLSEGEFDPDEETVECPLHGSLFSIRTGVPRTFPAFEPVATYKAYAEGDAVFVEFSA
jgi:3-phenylpropionate/trans-cinnamate dioxygenase ferredoxin subunit